MGRIEQSFNEYCDSNIHGSEARLREKVLSRWAQRKIVFLRSEVERLLKEHRNICGALGEFYDNHDRAHTALEKIYIIRTESDTLRARVTLLEKVAYNVLYEDIQMNHLTSYCRDELLKATGMQLGPWNKEKESELRRRAKEG